MSCMISIGDHFHSVIYCRITEHLGSGQFGTVYKGVWHSPDKCIDVAVKTLKPGASEKEMVKFLQEAAIMGQFHHPNIVKLHGVVTVGEPVSTKEVIIVLCDAQNTSIIITAT